MGVIAASGFVGSLGVAIVGAVLVGAGSGMAQMNALASIQHLAPVHARSGVTSAYFTLCYLAMSLPLIVAGEAAEGLGLRAVTAWYFVGLAVFVASALVLSRRLENAGTVLVRRATGSATNGATNRAAAAA
jgi:hypothetical protein